jgi:hypothetical protein
MNEARMHVLVGAVIGGIVALLLLSQGFSHLFAVVVFPLPLLGAWLGWKSSPEAKADRQRPIVEGVVDTALMALVTSVVDFFRYPALQHRIAALTIILFELGFALLMGRALLLDLSARTNVVAPTHKEKPLGLRPGGGSETALDAHFVVAIPERRESPGVLEGVRFQTSERVRLVERHPLLVQPVHPFRCLDGSRIDPPQQGEELGRDRHFGTVGQLLGTKEHWPVLLIEVPGSHRRPSPPPTLRLDQEAGPRNA